MADGEVNFHDDSSAERRGGIFFTHDDREQLNRLANIEAQGEVALEQIAKMRKQISKLGESIDWYFNTYFSRLDRELTEMRGQMALDADTLLQQMNDGTTAIGNRLTALTDELAAAIANSGAAQDAAVQAVLAKFQPVADHLTALGTDPDQPVPPLPVDPAPPTDTPPADQPPTDTPPVDAPPATDPTADPTPAPIDPTNPPADPAQG